jgi:hypothetical protein
MLTTPTTKWAQVGWRHWRQCSPTCTNTHWTFTSWTDASGTVYVKNYSSAGIGTSPNYQTYYVFDSYSLKYYWEFWRGSTPYDNPVAAFTPTTIEIFGETHNAASQMPGGTSNHNIFAYSYYKKSGSSTWSTVGSAASANYPAWYGAYRSTGVVPQYEIWDKACTS